MNKTDTPNIRKAAAILSQCENRERVKAALSAMLMPVDGKPRPRSITEALTRAGLPGGEHHE